MDRHATLCSRPKKTGLCHFKRKLDGVICASWSALQTPFQCTWDPSLPQCLRLTTILHIWVTQKSTNNSALHKRQPRHLPKSASTLWFHCINDMSHHIHSSSNEIFINYSASSYQSAYFSTSLPKDGLWSTEDRSIAILFVLIILVPFLGALTLYCKVVQGPFFLCFRFRTIF